MSIERPIKAELISDNLARCTELNPPLPLGDLSLEEVEQWREQPSAVARLMREKQRAEPLAVENCQLVELMGKAADEGVAFIRARHEVERLRNTPPEQLMEALNAANARWIEARGRVDHFIQTCPC